MTKTPFEEFLEALGFDIDQGVLVIPPAMDRVTLIKHLWNEAVLNAPPGALDGEDGPVMVLCDPADLQAVITYEKITYGDKAVIEAEGVVVCHLIG